MYAEGKGVRQDYTEAAHWCRKAAEQGFADAQRTLGSLYASGQGVPKDYVEAHMWLDIAAGAVPKWAELRDSVARNMTRSQIAEAQRRAREWKPKKAER